MGLEWLARTKDVPQIMQALLERYGAERIDEIAKGDAYVNAQAAMALALNNALDKTELSRGKRRAAATAMVELIMVGCTTAFMLGYQAKEDEGSTD